MILLYMSRQSQTDTSDTYPQVYASHELGRSPWVYSRESYRVTTDAVIGGVVLTCLSLRSSQDPQDGGTR